MSDIKNAREQERIDEIVDAHQGCGARVEYLEREILKLRRSEAMWRLKANARVQVLMQVIGDSAQLLDERVTDVDLKPFLAKLTEAAKWTQHDDVVATTERAKILAGLGRILNHFRNLYAQSMRQPNRKQMVPANVAQCQGAVLALTNAIEGIKSGQPEADAVDDTPGSGPVGLLAADGSIQEAAEPPASEPVDDEDDLPTLDAVPDKP